jgi:hypothetical protein
MEQSVWRLAAGWTVCDSNAGEDEIFRTISDGCLSLELSGCGVALTNHSQLVPRVKKEYSCAIIPHLRLHGLY